jgi:hypothetical protein
MASKKPLTQTAGLVEQLQSVDTLTVGTYDLPNTISDDDKVLITVNSAAVWDYVPHDSTVNGTIASHDTTATGVELNTLTDGSDADSLHVHPAAVITGNTTFYLTTTGNDSTGNGTLANPWKSVNKAVREIYEMEWERDAVATISIGDGEYEFRETLIKNHSADIVITTTSALQTVAVTNIDSVTTNGSYYDLRLTTSNTTGLVAGELVCSRSISGSRSYLSGAWKILTVHDATDITIQVKTRTVTPTTGAISFNYYVPKAILIPIDSIGFLIEDSHVTFESVSFRYDTGASADTAIEFSGCDNVVFDAYVGFNGFPAAGLSVLKQSNVDLDDTYFSDCGTAVWLSGRSYIYANHSVFAGGSFGLSCFQSDIDLHGCGVYGNDTRGVQAIEFSSYRARDTCVWRDNLFAGLVNMGSLGYPRSADNTYASNGTDLSPASQTYGNSDSFMRTD